jgi:Methyltransferase domain
MDTPHLDIQRHEHGIISIPAGDHAPPVLEIDDAPLQRFMDRIYVPAPTELLSTEQVRVVNALRRQDVDTGRIAPANQAVRRRFAALADVVRPRAVLEWGCGFHPFAADLPKDLRYIAVDIDPSVVAAGCQAGLQVTHPDDAPSGPFDLAVSIFVFHFDVPSRHLRVLADALAPEGLAVANVYRRSADSRARLARSVESAGLTLRRIADTDRLCRNHEYWIMTIGHDVPPEVLGTLQ